MSKEKSTIADNIKKYRNTLGISQDQLSKKADLAFHTIATRLRFQLNRAPLQMIYTISSCLP